MRKNPELIPLAIPVSFGCGYGIYLGYRHLTSYPIKLTRNNTYPLFENSSNAKATRSRRASGAVVWLIPKANKVMK
jgi:hypothetical protein